MVPDVSIGEYLRFGGVFYDIEGSTAAEAYHSLSARINLPSSVSPRIFSDALCAREAVLSTAVGNGIAIPHSQQPLAKSPQEQRIFICYLKTPVNMNAMDNKRVHTMIIPLSCSVQTHLHIISRLARLLTKSDFRKALELRQGLNELYPLIRTL